MALTKLCQQTLRRKSHSMLIFTLLAGFCPLLAVIFAIVFFAFIIKERTKDIDGCGCLVVFFAIPALAYFVCDACLA